MGLCSVSIVLKMTSILAPPPFHYSSFLFSFNTKNSQKCICNECQLPNGMCAYSICYSVQHRMRNLKGVYFFFFFFFLFFSFFFFLFFFSSFLCFPVVSVDDDPRTDR